MAKDNIFGIANGKNIISVFIVLQMLFIEGIYAQINIEVLTFEQLDSLANDALRKQDSNSVRSLTIDLIKLAREQEDTLRIAHGYSYFLSSQDIDEALSYSDSIIDLTKGLSNHYYYPAYGFLSKGDILFKKGTITEALKAYVEAKEYADLRNNKQQEAVLLQRIAKLKTMLGDHQEALDLHKAYLNESMELLDNTERTKINQLNGYYNLAQAYLNLHLVDSAYITINLGKLKAVQYNIETDIVKHFADLGAEIDYYFGDYQKALKHFDEDRLNAEGLHLINNLYYSGKIQVLKKNDQLAISYFELMDSVLLSRGFPFRYAKDGLAELSGIYKKQNMPKDQLRIINRYLEVDSAQIAFSQTMMPLINNKFDKPTILAERRLLLSKLDKNKSLLGLFTIVIVIALFLVVFLMRTRYILQKRIKELRTKGFDASVTYIKENKSEDEDENSELYDRIRKALKDFEESKGFLEKDLSLPSLATSLETNSTYLSKFVNKEMGINFSTYLNGLRIQNAIYMLNNDDSLKKYNLYGLANLFGYQNTNTFSRAFIKATGIKPSTYIKELAKSK